MQIVTYRSAMDIDVKFLDEHGFIYKHNIYSNFKNGWIKNPYDRNIQHITEYVQCVMNGMIFKCLQNGIHKTYIKLERKECI